MRRPLEIIGGLVFLALFALVGCGTAGTGMVTGKVTLAGKNVPTGRITFIPEKGSPAVGVIESGAYTIPRIASGPVKITIETSPPGPKIIVPGQPLPPKEDPAAKKQEYVATPARYARPDQSDLRYTVVSGSQTHDIDLKP